MNDQLPLHVDLEPPVDTSTQVARMPGLDARCEAGLTADTCRWPFCDCRFPDRTKEAAA